MTESSESLPDGRSKESAVPAEPNPRRRFKRPLLLLVVVTTVLMLVGGGFAYANHRATAAENLRVQVAAAKDAKAAEAAKAAKAAQESRDLQAAREAKLKREAAVRREAEAEYEACREGVDPLLKDLKTVDSRLDVGITESTFSDLVGAASVSYGEVDVQAISGIVGGKCLTAAASLETALNKYTASAKTWNDCLYETAACTTKSIERRLQRDWSAASGMIMRAERSLKAADPAKAAVEPDATSGVT